MKQQHQQQQQQQQHQKNHPKFDPKYAREYEQNARQLLAHGLSPEVQSGFERGLEGRAIMVMQREKLSVVAARGDGSRKGGPTE